MLTVFAAFVAGLLAGAVHYGSLWWNVQLLAAGGSPVKAAAVQFARLAVIAGVLLLAVQFGALPLLAAAGGVVVTRFVAVRRIGGVP